MLSANMAAIQRSVWLRTGTTIMGLYICPVLLLAAGSIPFSWRFYVLVLLTILAICKGVACRERAVTFGLVLPSASAFIRWSILPSLALTVAIVLSGLPHRQLSPERWGFYLFFVFISAPAQEFLYRSFLFEELKTLDTPWWGTVILSALLYSFMHLIYKDVLTLALTFTIGVFWAVAYRATRNFYIVAVSHAIVGACAIYLGVI